MPYSALNSNYWRLNFENPSIGSRVMWRQHYDIHTDIHTYIQTYIHTDRQTEPNYYIDYLIKGKQTGKREVVKAILFKF